MLYYREKEKCNLKEGVWRILSIALVCFCFAVALPKVEKPVAKTTLSVENLAMQGPMPLFGPTKKTLATGSFTEPAKGVLTSAYGARWGKTHWGIDIGGESDSSVIASDGGVVAFSGWVEGYGNFITLDHQNGYETSYAHLNAILVSTGDAVAQGQEIALMGSTGNSTGPHLHFEVKKNGEYVDPQHFVLY